MRSLFTIHAGEFLAGDFIQRKYPRLGVWIPARDTGIDLLVTDEPRRNSVALQVKYSRDFTATHMRPALLRGIKAAGWWSLNRAKIASSQADFWVFSLVGTERRSADFVIIPPEVLLRRLDSIHGSTKTIQTYLWVTMLDRCWEARGLRERDQDLLAEGRFKNDDREFSAYLNNWRPLERLRQS